MILTCPDCATSYFVDEERIPPEGRSVKCSACGNRWRAFREARPEPAPEPAAAREPETYEPDPVEEIIVDPPVLAAEDVEIVAEPAEPPGRRPPPPKPPKNAHGRGAALAWIGVAAVVAVVAGGLVFRDQVVGVWPGGAQLFAAVGLPVDRLGLVIDGVKSQATFQGGRPVLSITGAIRNTRGETVTSPALRISLVDKAGKPVAAKIARPLNARIPAGARRYFAIVIADPPAGAHALDIAFETEAGHAAAPADAHPVEAVLGPEPMEATPIPESHDAPADHG